MNSILEDFKQAFKTGNILYQLIVINVVVFLFFGVLNVVMSLAGQAEAFQLFTLYFRLPSNIPAMLTQPWSLLTHFFMHLGFFHILFNMLWLFWFGRIITEYLGQNKVLGFYIWGGLGGALLYLLAYNTLPLFAGTQGILLGASGATTAVIVAAAVFQPNFTLNLMFLGPVKLKYIAGVVVGISFLQSAGTNAGGNIAHLGGALVGYISMKQLQSGNDWSKPIVSLITWVKSLFKPQPKIKVSYRSERKEKARTNSKSKSKSPVSKTTNDTTSQEEIDAILDKISDKGYDALSKSEKQKLFNASKD